MKHVNEKIIFNILMIGISITISKEKYFVIRYNNKQMEASNIFQQLWWNIRKVNIIKKKYNNKLLILVIINTYNTISLMYISLQIEQVDSTSKSI